MPPQSCRLPEWISLKNPPNGIIPDSDELFAALKEIPKLQECTSITRSRPHVLRDIKWLVIEAAWTGKSFVRRNFAAD
ncbi:hypothetical protein N7537_000818 [Penicillium hordei]|uniref:Uncharacterized protein n=1 Tax=Penicillium hordei TaxID=40994 RepID=A0AAD6H8G9_9EURO|nr:uncharacterized protein N7537_000818 [Penicillium hordei]KAJ5615704.1 hypothetical protein N7537_000818 [Penicillium hordei]